MIDYDSLSAKLRELMPEFSTREAKVPLSKEELCIQLAGCLYPGGTLTSDESENIVCNYFYLTDAVWKDLREIDARIASLNGADQAAPKDDDYEHKKLRYFSGINKKVRNEIITFLANGIPGFLLQSKSYKYTDREDDDLEMLFFSGRYDYAFFGRYYDVNYDFSTEAKIRFIPGVELIKMQETVAEYIELKKTDPEKFSSTIDEMVSKNRCIQYIRDIVKNRFYLFKRAELFETLADLYDNQKYNSFISLAMTQLEGVFYDCITIMNKKEMGNKAGTLVEKADKVFSENQKVKQALYPHFAFTVPRLRNEIAHNGIATADNPFHLCNEIILDLYCIVHWACHLSDDKYIAIRMTYDKIKEIQENPDLGADEPMTVFTELFSCYQVCDRDFVNVLSNPDECDEELDFYETLSAGQPGKTLKEVVLYVAGIVKSESFWNGILKIIIETTDHTSGKPFDLIDFILALKNAIIPVLAQGSSERVACQEASKALKAFEN